MRPKLLKAGGESLTQFIERLKDAISQPVVQKPKDLFHGIELRAVGWQSKRHQTIRPVDLPTTMTGRIIEHDSDPLLRPRLTKLIQKDLQAVCLPRGQEQEEGSSRLWFDRRIDPEPFVVVLDDPGRSKPFGAPAPSQPRFETKTSFIEGDRRLKLLPAQEVPKVFLAGLAVRAGCADAVGVPS